MATAAVKFDPEQHRKSVSERRRHYESIFVLNPGMEQKTVESFIEKLAQILTSTEASLLRQDDWGKLRMAYEMDKHAQGRYFYFRFIGSESTLRAFERALKLEASVLRFQSVRLSDNLSQTEIDDLLQRAPREPSNPPNNQSDDNFEYMN